MPFMTQIKNSGTRIQVRACLALILVIGVTVGFFMKLIDGQMYFNLALMAVTWYFAKKQTQDQSNDNGNGNSNNNNGGNNGGNNPKP